MGAKLMESCQRRESGFALAKGPLGGPGDVKVQVEREVSSRKLVLCPISFCFLAEKVVGHLLIVGGWGTVTEF